MSEELGSDTWYTAILDGQTFRGKAVQYADVNGWAMFEGDICLGRTEDVRRATEARQADEAGNVAFGVVISGQEFRWPDGVVPYEIDPAMPNQNRVTDAIAHWESNTAVRFVRRTQQNSGQFANYVRFFEGDGCWSEVGMQGDGQQQVSLGPNCTTGNAIHEIGHTVGLWHEQSREDRDSFVQIIWANIDPTKVHNFDQHITDGDDAGAYDYGSIMHYPRKAFSTNNQDTIVPLQAGAQIGQRDALSDGDKAAVRQMYGGRLIKKVVDQPHRNIKKLVDDPPVNVKKLQDDQQFKKINDDLLRFPIPVPGPGPVSPGANPFLLATPHHAEVGGQDAELSLRLSQLDGLVVAGHTKLAVLQSAVDAAAVELTAALQARAALLGG
jgi:hypothetical protein